MLITLVTIPVLAGLYLLLQNERRKHAKRYGNFGTLLNGANGQQLGIYRHIPVMIFLTGLAILMISLARPQAIISLPRIEGTIILAFDVSGSMAAGDLQPTRMEAAKAAARDFVARQPTSVQIGVVAFSDGGFAVQSPTNEQEAIMASINRLTPQRGTSLAHGILASLNTITAGINQTDQDQENSTDITPLLTSEEIYQHAVIILLTDGENNVPPDPFSAAQTASDHGVRIYPIGIGSETGAILDIEGFSVYTQLNKALLQQIAQITGGIYFHAQNEEDLRAIYENITPKLVIKPEEMEVTSIFAGTSMLILLIGGAFSLQWFSRMP